MARLKKQESDKRTAHLPRTRCTPAERATVEAKAAQAGLTLGEYQRRLCLEGMIVQRDSVTDTHTVIHLSRIGNNLNQLARIANIEGGLDPMQAQELDEVLGIVRSAIEALMDGS